MMLKRAYVVGRCVCVLIWVALALAAPAAAQKPTFDIEGVVTDGQQGVLPGATVTLQNVATGLSREIATDADGRYVFTSLPPAGQYVLQTALSGFATERRENLTFNAGQRVVLNVTLKLSSVQETVTVAGDSPVVQTTTSEVTKTIESRELATLPVPERNYFRLLTLDSNVVARGPGTNGLYVGGGDVWNFGTYVDGTSNFSKWLTLQRAPQRGLGRFRAGDGQPGADHHQPVLGRVRRTLGRRDEHDHQERQQHLRGGRRCWWCDRATRTRSRRSRPRRCRSTSSNSAATSAVRSSTIGCSSSAATSGAASGARSR